MKDMTTANRTLMELSVKGVSNICICIDMDGNILIMNVARAIELNFTIHTKSHSRGRK